MDEEYIKISDALECFSCVIGRDGEIISEPDDDPAYQAIEKLPAAEVVPIAELRDCRNELCILCGKYKTRHLGSCDDCRWKDV